MCLRECSWEHYTKVFTGMDHGISKLFSHSLGTCACTHTQSAVGEGAIVNVNVKAEGTRCKKLMNPGKVMAVSCMAVLCNCNFFGMFEISKSKVISSTQEMFKNLKPLEKKL